jgi:protein tyrosine phosphatase (PTP) superfamily phosphohydrolase (DUF442 family)
MKDIFNYLYLTEKLSSSGMPTPEQLKEVAEAGVKFVVNLATSKSEGAIPNEGEVFANLGVDYLSIPVDWEKPTQQNLEDFMNAMDAHKNVRVLVHCQANFRATGFVALYRVLRLGWKKEEAFVDLRKIWNPEEYPVWQKFIETKLTTK